MSSQNLPHDRELDRQARTEVFNRFAVVFFKSDQRTQRSLMALLVGLLDRNAIKILDKRTERRSNKQ